MCFLSHTVQKYRSTEGSGAGVLDLVQLDLTIPQIKTWYNDEAEQGKVGGICPRFGTFGPILE